MTVIPWMHLDKHKFLIAMQQWQIFQIPHLGDSYAYQLGVLFSVEHAARAEVDEMRQSMPGGVRINFSTSISLTTCLTKPARSSNPWEIAPAGNHSLDNLALPSDCRCFGFVTEGEVHPSTTRELRSLPELFNDWSLSKKVILSFGCDVDIRL